MITYKIEPWADYYRDCQELWLEHYEEIAVEKDRMPMRPHLEEYEAMDRIGILQILTARDGGKMVGYVLTVIRPHLHYADVRCGFEDSYFLSKGYRGARAGMRLIEAAISNLKASGVQKVFFMTKSFLDQGRMFEFLGFKHSDSVYAKWIGD